MMDKVHIEDNQVIWRDIILPIPADPDMKVDNSQPPVLITSKESRDNLEMKMEDGIDQLLEKERQILNESTTEIEKAWQKIRMERAIIEAQREELENEKETNAMNRERQTAKEIGKLKIKMERQENGRRMALDQEWRNLEDEKRKIEEERNTIQRKMKMAEKEIRKQRKKAEREEKERKRNEQNQLKIDVRAIVREEIHMQKVEDAREERRREKMKKQREKMMKKQIMEQMNSEIERQLAQRLTEVKREQKKKRKKQRKAKLEKSQRWMETEREEAEKMQKEDERTETLNDNVLQRTIKSLRKCFVGELKKFKREAKTVLKECQEFVGVREGRNQMTKGRERSEELVYTADLGDSEMTFVRIELETHCPYLVQDLMKALVMFM
ncbi:hypothetical protein NFI96_009033 [Prochilodus magdalenae]|nr:hypothetical protein NFI96_009033 [Prochilodus magdalenae]